MPPCWDTQGLFSAVSTIFTATDTPRILKGHKTQIVFDVSFRQVCLFLKRGANQNAADIDEKTPLAIAVEAANADIVTL